MAAMYDSTFSGQNGYSELPGSSGLHDVSEPSAVPAQLPGFASPLAQLPVRPSAQHCSGAACSALNALLASLPPQPPPTALPPLPPAPPVTPVISGGGRPSRRPTRLSALVQRLRGAGGGDLRRQGLAGLTVGLPLGVALMAALGASPALVAPLAAVIPGYVLAAFARARPPGSAPPATGEGTLRMVLRRFLAGHQMQLRQRRQRRRRRRELTWMAGK